MYHVGCSTCPPATTNWSSGSGELTVLPEALYNMARTTSHETATAGGGAHERTGVVGVRWSTTSTPGVPACWSAPRSHQRSQTRTCRPPHASGRQPFLRTCLREFWMLRQAGFRPVGIAVETLHVLLVRTGHTTMRTRRFVWRRLAEHGAAGLSRSRGRCAVARNGPHGAWWARGGGAVGIVGAESR